MDTKACIKCKRLLPLENFHKDKSLKSGMRGRCKQCFLEDLQKRIQQDPEGYRAKRRASAQRLIDSDPERAKAKYVRNREQRAQKCRRWYQKNREKVLAQKKIWQKGRDKSPAQDPNAGIRWQVRFAISKGIIIKPDSCSECGCDSPLVAHHANYNKPLEITWLCQSCHMRTHANQKYAFTSNAAL